MSRARDALCVAIAVAIAASLLVPAAVFAAPAERVNGELLIDEFFIGCSNGRWMGGPLSLRLLAVEGGSGLMELGIVPLGSQEWCPIETHVLHGVQVNGDVASFYDQYRESPFIVVDGGPGCANDSLTYEGWQYPAIDGNLTVHSR